MIARLWNKFTGRFKHRHVWRRAHKTEDQALSYCRRCPVTREIRKRKQESS